MIHMQAFPSVNVGLAAVTTVVRRISQVGLNVPSQSDQMGIVALAAVCALQLPSAVTLCIAQCGPYGSAQHCLQALHVWAGEGASRV